MLKRKKISIKKVMCTVLCIILVSAFTPPDVFAIAPSITIDAGTNEGVLSPNLLGNMFEWEGDSMNGTWAERALNRNFEMDSVNSFSSPLYDHFSNGSLDHSKWTPKVIGGSNSGSYSVSGTQLTLTGGADSRYGLLSRNVQNAVLKDTTVKAEIVSKTALNSMVSIYSGNGGSTYDKFIEFGVENGVLKVYGDGITPWSGGAATLPAKLEIVAGHKKGNLRDFTFYYNNTLVHSVGNFSNIGDNYQVLLYGWGDGNTIWDSISIYQNDLYDGFDGTSLDPHFTPVNLVGSTAGSVSVSGGQLTINGSANCRYGVMSDRIRNSAVDWTEIEARVNSYSGTNALLSIYGGTGAGDFSKFVEYGVEGGVLKVFSDTGAGNWTGGSVTLPGTLKIQISPYYTNGRNIRFYWNGNLVYAFWQVKNIPKDDFRLFLYGYGSSVTRWDYIKINQGHFTDAFDPHFEGVGLPGFWTPSTLEGSYGSINSQHSFCTITGAANSRYGIGTMTFNESDIKPYKVSALLTNYSGMNGLVHLTTGRARGSMGSNFVEFGVEGGYVKVFTPTSIWTGPAATLPAKLDMYVGPYKTGGRTITFVYNGEPVYELNNYTPLENAEFKAFLYGYGTSTTTWDYCDAYPLESWIEDGYDGTALYSLDDSLTPVSGKYSQKIQILSANSGSKGISQPAIDVKSGKNYRVTMWLKQSGLTTPIQVKLGPNVGENSGYMAYASGSISSVGTSFTKHTVNLVSNTTDINAKLYIGTQGLGTLWIDQISVMPTDSTEVSYGGWRKEFVDRLVELNPVSLRWPGGIIADWYDWRDGIGSNRDQRPPQFYAQWNSEWLSNDVGVDEFLQLCEALGFKPVLNVNWGSGTATNAANFVEYVNGSTGTTWGSTRMANGHSQPYNIKFWEVGNETWGGWTPGHTDAQTFANSYISFRDAMIVKDTTIKLIAEGGDGNTSDQSWNTTMITTAGTKMDELSIHYYSPQGLPSGYNDLNVYNAAVSVPLVIKDRLKASQDVIANYSSEDIKIAVTEYNAMYFSSIDRRTRTMEAALQVAGDLHAFMSDPSLTDHNDYSCLAEFWDGSAIRLGQRGNFVTPSFHILNLYSNKRGPMKVKSSVICDTFNSPTVGNVPAISNVPYLDVAATRSMNGTKLYVSVINRNSTSDYTVPINIQSVSGVQSSANVYTVTTNNYMDMNSWANPNLVPLQSSTISNASTSFSYTVPKNSVTVFELTVSGLTSITGPVLTGKVTTSSGTPISGAIVTTNTGASSTTDANGYYMIAVPEGTYTLSITRLGFQNRSMNNVYVYPSTGTTCNPIKMVP